jgi:trimethylamine--corrinoid protein Co-methyltransferase
MKPDTNTGKKLSQGFGLDSFDDDELYEIHLATLEVLEKTGLFIETDEALEIFDGAGAEVNHKNKIVKIPPYVVDDAIRSAPSKIVLAGRRPEKDTVLEAGQVHFTNFSEGVEVVDPYSGKQRTPIKADLANAAILVDYLSDIDVCEKAVGAGDVPQDVVPLHNAEAMLANTTKHCCVGPGNGFLLNKLVDMAATIVGGLRTGSVINVLSMAMAGGTSPATLAGTLVTHNAEVLGGITLNQLASKGAPVIYGSSTTAMDLKLGTASVGTPECAIISAAVARLARYYALPSYVAGG